MGKKFINPPDVSGFGRIRNTITVERLCDSSDYLVLVTKKIRINALKVHIVGSYIPTKNHVKIQSDS